MFRILVLQDEFRKNVQERFQKYGIENYVVHLFLKKSQCAHRYRFVTASLQVRNVQNELFRPSSLTRCLLFHGKKKSNFRQKRFQRGLRRSDFSGAMS